MRIFPFKILILAILLPPLLFIITIQALENRLQSHYATAIENTYLGDTRPLLAGSIALQTAVSSNIDRYLQQVRLTDYGIHLQVTVTTADGNILYPAGFQDEPTLQQQESPAQIATENFRLLNQGINVKTELQLPLDAVLSLAILAVYICLSVVSLYFYYRANVRRIRREVERKDEELQRLEQIESTMTDEVNRLSTERRTLTGELNRFRYELDHVKEKALRNEDDLIEEIDALEKKLEKNLELQMTQQEEINTLRETIARYEKLKQKDKRTKIRNIEASKKRFATLYKNLTMNDRALEGLANLNDDMQIKAEEVIHQLNDDPKLVPIKRKVFVGKRDRKTVLEIVFAYKGRLYYRNLKDSSVEVLAIGTKNTQAKEMEFLNNI